MYTAYVVFVYWSPAAQKQLQQMPLTERNDVGIELSSMTGGSGSGSVLLVPMLVRVYSRETRLW